MKPFPTICFHLKYKRSGSCGPCIFFIEEFKFISSSIALTDCPMGGLLMVLNNKSLAVQVLGNLSIRPLSSVIGTLPLINPSPNGKLPLTSDLGRIFVVYTLPWFIYYIYIYTYIYIYIVWSIITKLFVFGIATLLVVERVLVPHCDWLLLCCY